nr:insulin-like growth factor-binding protein 4 [Pelodiscus sinensis]|eukprot:XP_025036048.1 insulin-like growth factor-binding protein 4 [Pelodiscus sinensis]
MPSGGPPAVLLLATVGLCVSEEAIHCPPCSEEKLTRCKAPVGCEELVREPGCGCCATCALSQGTPCGAYTARCGSGNAKISVRAAGLGPLYCSGTDKEEVDHPNNSFSPCSIQDRKCLLKHQAKTRDRVNSGVKMRSNGNPQHREETRPIAQGSCQSELHRALERLAASQTRTHEDLYIIPIPNCDRNGNFHPKQCHPALDGQRGKCWCVDRKTGVKLLGSPEPKGDVDCHQSADGLRE